MGWLLLGVVLLSFFWGWVKDDEEVGFTVFVILLICWFAFLIYRYNTDVEWIAERAAEERSKQAERVRQETPHVIREADGSKVYAFKSVGRWHYFTRCPGEVVTTDTAYEQCTGSGKSRSCKELHESIVTK